MEIELRLSNVKEIEFALESGVDCISLGDEGCPYKIPNKNELYDLFNKILSVGIKPKLITPRVAQKDFHIIKNVIDVLADFKKNVDIVINDWGVLQLCQKHNQGMGIYFGRLIARSITDCPWGAYSLRKEKDFVKDRFLRHSFEHDEKIELMQQLNIKGIEVNSARGIEASLFNISQRGIIVNVHFGFRLLTVGRDCATARYFQLDAPNCIKKCETKLELDWDGVWYSPIQNDIGASELHKKMLKGAVVIGNRVLATGNSTIEDLKKINIGTLILDTEVDTNNLQARIAELRTM